MRTAPQPIVIGFAEDGDRNPIPLPSQIGIDNGAASFETGFPPLTMTPLVSGGIPPAGFDMNGILFMISAYCAWLQGGGSFFFDADFVTANTGYAEGAVLQSAADRTLFFYNTVDDNANDPDVDTTGWIPYSPVTASSVGDQAETLPAGPSAVALDPGVAFLDITPDPAGSTITDLTGAENGQIVSIRNQGGGNLSIFAGGAILLDSTITLLAQGSLTLRFRASIPAWVAI